VPTVVASRELYCFFNTVLWETELCLSLLKESQACLLLLGSGMKQQVSH